MSGTGIKASFITQLDANDVEDKEGVGAIRYEGGRWFKYIKHEDAVAGRVGYGVVYKGLTGERDSVVSSDSTQAPLRGAGVLMAALGQNRYGWIQIKGPATVPPSALAANVADGDLIKMSGVDGIIDDGNAAGAPVIGYAVDESAGHIVLDAPW